MIIWTKKETYGAIIEHNYLSPLEEAVRLHGKAPRSLQMTVLSDLLLYFTLDMNERSPTMVVTESMAIEFHGLVRRVMQYIDVESIESLDSQAVSEEVKHALYSYKEPKYYSPVAVNAYDNDQKLIRLSYFIHGVSPSEAFLLDGKKVDPAYCKYRSCRFFRRTLMRERIVWLPVAGANALEVFLEEKPAAVAVCQQEFAPTKSSKGLPVDEILTAARSAYPPGKGGRQPLPGGVKGLKVRLLRWLACQASVRRRFYKAWVFIDSDVEADDNAEHLYRWVRSNHPEINAWFLLSRSSSDWPRLSAEGFRLMPLGLSRKLLVLNSDHIISSYSDYEFGGLDRRIYGDLMKWRFSFVPHGISKDDVSHWLSKRSFDLFFTTSPGEYASIVEDGTPYTYTAREMRFTGFPRQDKLFELTRQIPRSEANVILVMPTWRASLINDRVSKGARQNPMSVFRDSEYAQHWRAILNNDKLHELTLEHGLKLVLMPHPCAAAYVKAFDPPAYVEIATKADTDILPLLCRSVALITDYSSIAFEMANIRRGVFYYQFDMDYFYGGGHNWREGYFDYKRDGFGPVATREDELVDQVRQFLLNHARVEPEYLVRMETALPKFDGQACKRVFENIARIRDPFCRSV